MPTKQIARDTRAGRIEGRYDAKFAGVCEVFVENFASRGEIGASCAITLDGRTVLDLWGGRKAPGGAPWTADTLCMVFSATKGATALAAHMLADRGLLDLDAPIALYWPEFASGGKEAARVSMTLDHSVGVPHVREPLPPDGLYDYAYMVERVAQEPAFWAPGTRHGYHGFTMAWTVGELVHRAGGRRLGKFFRDEVAEPLGLDFFIGLPEAFEPHVAPMIAAEPDPAWVGSKFIHTALNSDGPPARLFMRDFYAFDANSRVCRAAEVGSANGITNARGLAGMYAPLANGGALRGVRLVGADTLARMSRVSVAGYEDATLMIPTRFALGFMKAVDNRNWPNAVNSSLLLAEPAFGHVGAGGSLGFADPQCRMSFGYAMNRMGFGLLMNDRGQGLVDAAYAALGYRAGASGTWTM